MRVRFVPQHEDDPVSDLWISGPALSPPESRLCSALRRVSHSPALDSILLLNGQSLLSGQQRYRHAASYTGLLTSAAHRHGAEATLNYRTPYRTMRLGWIWDDRDSDLAGSKAAVAQHNNDMK
ncbi:hypothetical protein EYF80_010706 [Liparis tanakae]|uniref:Uncharacterized protein n=1 Tax=Liparis tanakae TaxID=230148 RepID=A0A4Z2IMN0_9TELE|nr:hypothetical protein EYF80_010706 [Liparis tanakae]